MDYEIIPKRASRCIECKRIIRSWNKSGLCTSCHTVKTTKERQARK